MMTGGVRNEMRGAIGLYHAGFGVMNVRLKDEDLLLVKKSITVELVHEMRMRE